MPEYSQPAAEGPEASQGAEGKDRSEPRVAVAVPVYNHAATLRDVVSGALEALRQGYEGVELVQQVIVVDDGSTDAPFEAIRDTGAIFRRHEKNRGKGAAILTAACAARELGCSHLVTLDADGQHDPAELPAFFEAILDDPHALHVGLRSFPDENVPASSRFGRQFSNFWLRVHTGQRLGDSQSGFRAYPLELLTELDFRDRRYSFEVEVLAKAAWAGVPLRDVPISVHYPARGERVSHFRIFQDNVRISLLNARLTVRALLPWPHRRLTPVHEDMPHQPGFTVIRPVDSVRDMLRHGVRPREMALSGALGMALGCLPLIGLQTISVLVTATWLGRNKFVALGVNQLCIPPVVPALSIEMGYFLRNGEFLTEISLQTLGYQAPQRLLEWLLGGLVLAPVLGTLVGGALYLLARSVNAQLKAARQRG